MLFDPSRERRLFFCGSRGEPLLHVAGQVRDNPQYPLNQHQLAAMMHFMSGPSSLFDAGNG
jgi:hypothetical protein